MRPKIKKIFKNFNFFQKQSPPDVIVAMIRLSRDVSVATTLTSMSFSRCRFKTTWYDSHVMTSGKCRATSRDISKRHLLHLTVKRISNNFALRYDTVFRRHCRFRDDVRLLRYDSRINVVSRNDMSFHFRQSYRNDFSWRREDSAHVQTMPFSNVASAGVF